MSRYLFGLDLDGASAPNDYQGLRTSVCGPESFLSALEAALGLSRHPDPLPVPVFNRRAHALATISWSPA